MLPELCFCPSCGEPRARRQFGDLYACRACHRAGEITGFNQPGRRAPFVLRAGQERLP